MILILSAVAFLLAIGLKLFHAPDLWVFIVSALGIVPLAGVMGKATEVLAHRLGPGLGALLNASLGNAAEMILALVALFAGQTEVVKASLTGAIIGNLLFILGLAMIFGGAKRQFQKFNATAAGLATTSLLLATIGLFFPTMVYYLKPNDAELPSLLLYLSEEISIVLIVTYILGIIFALKTHRHLYDVEEGDAHDLPPWSFKKAMILLIAAAAAVSLMAEFLVHSLEVASKSLGLTGAFVGVVIVAIVGNAAEHATAVVAAYRGKMNLAFTIAVESSRQVALLIAPLLVLIGAVFGKPMDLHFTALEVAAVGMSVLAVNFIAHDGETNWFEGAQLLAIYTILAGAFYFAG